MAKSYDYSKTWVTEGEAQELHEIIGIAIEVLDRIPGLANVYRDLIRAREIAALLLSDITEQEV